MTPDEWRTRVGRHIEERRIDLGLSKRQAAKNAGVSEIVWRQVESGKRQLAPGNFIAPTPEPLTRTKIAKALGWIPQAIDLFERDAAPAEVVIHSELHAIKTNAADSDEDIHFYLGTLRDRISMLEHRIGQLLGAEINSLEYGMVDDDYDREAFTFTFSRLDALEAKFDRLTESVRYIARQTLGPDADEEQLPHETDVAQ